MSAYIAYQTLRKYLDADRIRLAGYVDSHPRHAELDEALTALEWLRQAASVIGPDRQPTHQQEPMF